MAKIWRVGWVDEDGETVLSVPVYEKQAVGELSKSVDHYQLSPTADVWIEYAEVEWVKVIGAEK